MASNLKVDIVKPTATNGSLSLKGDSGGSATSNGISVDSSGDTSITGTTTIATADINGGTIDGTTIGASSAAVGSFTQVNADNIRLDGNTISSTDTNGNITFDPNGTGKIVAAAGTDWEGTVSQNSTSSIIERGSNANGEYVKFADGTMICTNRGLSASTNTDVSLPSTFTNSEYIVNLTHRDSSDLILSTQTTNRTTTNFRLRIQDSAGSFVSVSLMDYTAIGRWY